MFVCLKNWLSICRVKIMIRFGPKRRFSNYNFSTEKVDLPPKAQYILEIVAGLDPYLILVDGKYLISSISAGDGGVPIHIVSLEDWCKEYGMNWSVWKAICWRTILHEVIILLMSIDALLVPTTSKLQKKDFNSAAAGFTEDSISSACEIEKGITLHAVCSIVSVSLVGRICNSLLRCKMWFRTSWIPQNVFVSVLRPVIYESSAVLPCEA